MMGEKILKELSSPLRFPKTNKTLGTQFDFQNYKTNLLPLLSIRILKSWWNCSFPVCSLQLARPRRSLLRRPWPDQTPTSAWCLWVRCCIQLVALFFLDKSIFVGYMHCWFNWLGPFMDILLWDWAYSQFAWILSFTSYFFRPRYVQLRCRSCRCHESHCIGLWQQWMWHGRWHQRWLRVALHESCVGRNDATRF